MFDSVFVHDLMPTMSVFYCFSPFQTACGHRGLQGPVFAAMVDIDMAPLDEEEEINELNISSFDYLEMTQEQAEVAG